MNKSIFSILCLLSLLYIQGCGHGDDHASTFNGTWLFSGASCNEQTLTFGGFAAQITANNGTATQVYTSAGCIATISYAYAGSGSSLTATLQNVTCSPNPCTANWTTNGQATPVSCPQGFGSARQLVITINGSTASVAYNAGTVNCTDTYVRQ